MTQTKNQAGSPMPTAASVDTDLHLPDLHIKGFRGIKDLLISRLGRVMLLAGKNGTGKTTVLEAVRVYAARGRYADLVNVLWNREETVHVFDEDGDWGDPVPRWENLFHGRIPTSNLPISVGPSKGDSVSIQPIISSGRIPTTDELVPIQVDFQGFKREYQSLDRESRMFRNPFISDSNPPPVIQCESLGPDLPNSDQLARFWDKVALTDEESRAVDALNLIYSSKVERVAIVGDDARASTRQGRRPVVKLRDEPRPVPLKSLGDGAVRLFGVALALANSKDGFLLIDEAENGIHHSIQRDFWTMILKAAHQNNVQVLATTHSWDCVAGFAKAATEIEEVDGALVRLEKKGDRLRAVEYPSYDLDVIAKQGIEVR